MSREHEITAASAAWLGFAHHIVLAAFKGTVGLLFDSRALLSDALHSALDATAIVSDKVKMPWLSKKKAHPFRPGSGRARGTLFVVFLSVFLLMGSIQMGMSSISAFSKGEPAPPEYLAGVAIVISIALKEAVFQLQYRKSRKQPGDFAQALVEAHRFSLYSSVVVLIGIFGAMFGHARDIPVLLYMDPAAALVVAVLIILRVYRMVRNSVYNALVSDLQEEDAARFIETVQRVHGVITVDELKARENGHYVMVTARISVNPRITVMEANEIAARAKMLLMNRFSHIIDVSIQVMPYDPGYPYKSNYEGSGDQQSTLIQ
ncbi:cation diffusion facilitator family transporter [Paenibacillus sp. DYY-L-2]|uniref:cation diffusion facilitator family transporter n=1 Tax=Paenibacillus sp. DYY-L-2 TaxID=3447013 RepID=UPI003F507365